MFERKNMFNPVRTEAKDTTKSAGAITREKPLVVFDTRLKRWLTEKDSNTRPLTLQSAALRWFQ